EKLIKGSYQSDKSLILSLNRYDAKGGEINLDRYVVFDLETTGHSAAQDDKIIEIGMVIIENNKITNEFTTFLHPHKEIPPFISQLTGITNEDVANAPDFKEIAEKIVELTKNSYLVAHNISFDVGFLNAELEKISFPPLKNRVLDTVELSRIIYPRAPGFKLGQLANYLNLKHKNPHRALSDAYVTAELFLMLKTKLFSLPYETIDHLLKLEPTLKSDLFNLLNERKETLSFDLSNDKSIITYGGLAFKKGTEIKREDIYLETSYGDFSGSINEENGSLEHVLEHYEKRPGQRHMSEHIYDAFQLKKHALIEAETGTGKSLGYLLPAIYEAVKTRRRLVVSTFTIHLQSQLLEEEIPLIRKLLSFPFHVALLKGRRHYISLEKFDRELRSEQNNNYDVALTKAILLVWLTETKTGDIDEITLPSSGYYFYSKVSSDLEGAIDPSSPWFSYSYYQKAREKAQKADISITNHALLCTDMFNDYSFIPSYQKVIIDEAHHLEDTASRHYGLKLDYVNIIYTLNQIGGTKENGWLQNIIQGQLTLKDNTPFEVWDSVFSDTKYEIDQLFRLLFQYVIK